MIKNEQVIRGRKDPILRDYIPDQSRRNLMEISRSSTYIICQGLTK